MVHRYGDNDTGKPKGGDPRYACGVIKKYRTTRVKAISKEYLGSMEF